MLKKSFLIAAQPILYAHESSVDFIDSDIDSNYEIDFNNELVTNSTQMDVVENGNVMGENSLIEERAVNANFSRVSQRILFSTYFQLVTEDEGRISATCRFCKREKLIRGSLTSTSHFTTHLSVSNIFNRCTTNLI